MTLVFAIAIYVVIWWIVLFAMLPIGVRTQAEEGEVSPGTPESAPHQPRLLPKMLATTVVASIVFAAVYVDRRPSRDHARPDSVPAALRNRALSAPERRPHNKKSKVKRPCFLCRLNTPYLTGLDEARRQS